MKRADRLIKNREGNNVIMFEKRKARKEAIKKLIKEMREDLRNIKKATYVENVHRQIDHFRNYSEKLSPDGWSLITYFIMNNTVSYLDWSWENKAKLKPLKCLGFDEEPKHSGYVMHFYIHSETDKIYAEWDWNDDSCNNSHPPSAAAFFEIETDVYNSFIDILERICEKDREICSDF